ncbi:MAG: glycosyl hydrolase family 2 [Bacteroidales bacterium]|nr:glycosyl hydrolase family 2 [Bacteroidales bacterium]
MKSAVRLTLILLMAAGTCAASAQTVQETAKPSTRWWWMGSAVTPEGLTECLSEYSRAGIGGVEITPIYGVQGNEARDIDFLSPKWMEMYRHTYAECRRLGIQLDMNTGTGWPFGGPEVSVEDAATSHFFQEYEVPGGRHAALEIRFDIDKLHASAPKQLILNPLDTLAAYRGGEGIDLERNTGVALLDKLMAYREGKVVDLTSKVRDGMLEWDVPEGGSWRLIALFVGKSFQEVNRAAPGGEGLVLDHYNAAAVRRYLDRFDKAFEESGSPYPHTFFNDSYEVYDAEWTPSLLEEFRKRRGYRLEDHFPEFLDNGEGRPETSSRIVSDYRETLSDLLKESFTRQWTEWAHGHGSLTRNQAHGSPGNLIDLYGIVDIPECEGFGLSDFNIRGLRKDSLTRKNHCDLSMLKYASSAAHVSGKPITSSETFTWLTEHFRTSLSQCKPDLDLMFVSGVNKVFFHGTAYSPSDETWPGWKFYASVDMSPTNPQWRDMEHFDRYIERCQEFLQDGSPDNDFLLYLPIYDMWAGQPGTYLAFEIDKMGERTPEFIEAVGKVEDGGYDADYISDDFLRKTKIDHGCLKTSGGSSYRALILPAVHYIPHDVLKHVLKLASKGADVVFMDSYPSSVPGYGSLKSRSRKFRRLSKRLPEADFSKVEAHRFGKGRIITGSDCNAVLALCQAPCEEMKSKLGLHLIRRSNTDGCTYFVSDLQAVDIDSWVTLGTDAQAAVLHDPMTGASQEASLRKVDGRTQIHLSLASGQSVLIRTYFDAASMPEVNSPCRMSLGAFEYSGALDLDRDWNLSIVWSEPEVRSSFRVASLRSWTELGEPLLRRIMGTGTYSRSFVLPEIDCEDWVLDLGDVRESAVVRINGEQVACLWAVPYRISVGQWLHEGVNSIEVDVTNLPANRISDLDRSGFKWRRFKNINTVTVKYEPSDYSGWDPMPSGLCGGVRLIPVGQKDHSTVIGK